ncbi:MAG TPA: metalloregulator ArsR/SmtB family transcription factor [Terrimesophilobacter sp.]|jgi:Predicted transcriptional regulators|uniref:ArsR/SmtB family transcription factor n=1 Tax=Terrimesophilobacter sp. TaxID=2906435 RepID=UPI002F93F741
MADIFDVVADPTRRELLQVLLERYRTSGSEAGEISVGELVDKLGLSQPTVSKHLKVLRDIDLVTVREEGQHRYYRLDSAPLEVLEDWLIPFLGADFDDGLADEAGTTVFAAWSGSGLPKPLRRMADSIEHSADAGAAVGRTVADASHQVRTVIEGATHAIEEASASIERKVIDPIREKLGKRGDGA